MKKKCEKLQKNEKKQKIRYQELDKAVTVSRIVYLSLD